ncbi:RES domain-containing protein [Massilia sp. CCM 8733]|uniref:RES domain-containing protein n=1 Tax=Massilia mucilaginosa TaxID=2609282 RepID=A0ABX0P124_9BURK|nr:RES family NAD+ phosphorylase [Massilia mucilaginosa]NHZ92217.1 RES domain-containing protein [Massilia mucilaginosa]
MPKTKGKATPAAAVPASIAVFDPPPLNVDAANVTRTSLDVNTILHRIHQDTFGALQFNPGFGNARFSPINDAVGKSIPTIYAGETFECAAMESVFHDVPYAPGLKAYDKAKLAGQVHSIVKTKELLVLADFGTKALHKLGIPRASLTDTEKDRYPFTRTVAQAVHAQCPDLQGICWTSRQDDKATAYVLFGDRIAARDLQHVGTSKSVTGDAATYDALLDLAEVIGVDIVPGNMP